MIALGEVIIDFFVVWFVPRLTEDTGSAALAAAREEVAIAQAAAETAEAAKAEAEARASTAQAAAKVMHCFDDN